MTYRLIHNVQYTEAQIKSLLKEPKPEVRCPKCDVVLEVSSLFRCMRVECPAR